MADTATPPTKSPSLLYSAIIASRFGISAASNLLITSRIFLSTLRISFAARLSSLCGGVVPSTTNKTTSASLRQERADLTRYSSNFCFGFNIPGVSRNTSCPSSVSQIPEILFRVVCGLGVTIATFSPTSLLRSVDLPTLGRPHIVTNPDL